jgi:hypothetical protein
MGVAAGDTKAEASLRLGRYREKQMHVYVAQMYAYGYTMC